MTAVLSVVRLVSLPSRERELKLSKNLFSAFFVSSLPSRERELKPRIQAMPETAPASLPSRERELKLDSFIQGED